MFHPNTPLSNTGSQLLIQKFKHLPIGQSSLEIYDLPQTYAGWRYMVRYGAHVTADIL